MRMGLAIRVRRTMQEMNLEDLSKKTGLSISYLSLIETGKRDPSVSTVKNIADQLNIKMSKLFEMAEELEYANG